MLKNSKYPGIVSFLCLIELTKKTQLVDSSTFSVFQTDKRVLPGEPGVAG